MKNVRITNPAFESRKSHLCGQREAACRSAAVGRAWAASAAWLGMCSPRTVRVAHFLSINFPVDGAPGDYISNLMTNVSVKGTAHLPLADFQT